MPRHLGPSAAVAALAALVLTGCSSSGPAAVLQKQHISTKLPSGFPTKLPSAAATSSQVGKPSQISVRYANFFVHKGAAGPALDIYEGQTGQPGKLLVHDLAYGSVSPYIHPDLVPDQAATSQGLDTLPLYAIPTGEDPVKQQGDVAGLSALADDGTHPQLTVLLQGEGDTISPGPLGGLSFTSRIEKGTYNGSTATDTPPAGTTELLADDSSVTAATNIVSGAYLMIGSSCASAANGDPSEKGLPQIFAADGASPKSTFAVFPEQPGTYQLSVATTDISVNLTCAKLTQRQGQASATLTQGQQVEVYVYGPTKTDLHLAVSPVGT